MDRVIISWTFRNWITIILMVAIGMSIVGIVASFVKSNLPGGNQSGASSGVSLSASVDTQ